MQGKQIVFVGEMKVEVSPLEFSDTNLEETEIISKTLFSLISPGTELAMLTGLADISQGRTSSYPIRAGYAAVDEVLAVGAKVDQFKVGDIVFNQGNHVSHHRVDILKMPILRVPSGVSLEEAPFARICGVSMTTLRTTRARPGDLVAVFGLGLVGNLASQVFQASGYEVVGIDINAGRREVAKRCGIRHVIDPAKDLAAEIRSETGEDSCHLVLECSGSAKAAVDAMKVAKIGAEIVQIGTPWKEYQDISASQILKSVFRKYLHLRGGWEWELPLFPTKFAKGSILQNYEHALSLLARKEIKVNELITHVMKPEQAQEAYEGLLSRQNEYIGVLFNWQ